jgi:hypothetical protein
MGTVILPRLTGEDLLLLLPAHLLEIFLRQEAIQSAELPDQAMQTLASVEID